MIKHYWPFMGALGAIGITLTAGLSVAIARDNARLDAMRDDSEYMIARVVGYDCDGASGPIIAAQEDELPPCAQIEPLPHVWAIRIN